MKRLFEMKQKLVGLAAGLLALGAGFISQPAQAYHPIPQTANLKIFWNMDAPGSFTANANKVASVSIVPTTTTAQNTTGNGSIYRVAGKKGFAAQFIGNDAGINRNFPYTMIYDFSISFWMKTTQVVATDYGNYYQAVDLIDDEMGGTQADWGIRLNNGGKLIIGSGNPNYRPGGSANNDINFKTTTNLNDGVWHHIVMTRNNATGQVIIYVDGTNVGNFIGGQGPRCFANGDPNTIRIGGINGGPAFIGALDEIYYYPRILTPAEVTALKDDATSPTPLAPSDFYCSYNFDDLPDTANTTQAAIWNVMDTNRNPVNAAAQIGKDVMFIDPTKVTVETAGRYGTASKWNRGGQAIANQYNANYTWAFWIKTTAPGMTANTSWYNMPMIYGRDAGGDQADFGVGLHNGQLRYAVGSTRANDISLLTPVKINDGTWHHIACTREDSTGSLVLYQDGIRVAEDLRPGAAGGTLVQDAFRGPRNASAIIDFMQNRGASNDANNQDNTVIDDFMIYDTRLDSNQIMALFSAVSTNALQVTPASPLRFNSVDVRVGKPATPTTIDVTIKNNGNRPILFLGGATGTPGLKLVGTNVSDFAITSVTPATTAPLAVGASVVVRLTFNPVATLPHQPRSGLNATLQITTDDDLDGQVNLSLIGDAVPVSMSDMTVQ